MVLLEFLRLNLLCISGPGTSQNDRHSLIQEHIGNQLLHSPKSYDSETCHAALRTQSLQRVYNLYSLGGLNLLWQV